MNHSRQLHLRLSLIIHSSHCKHSHSNHRHGQPNSPSLHQLRYHNRQLQRPQVTLRNQPSNYPFSSPHSLLSSQQPSRHRQ